jgi:DNA-directed RNA polymerase subunit H (RpoH/RPB5)
MFKVLFKLLGLSSETKEQKSKRNAAIIDNDPVLRKLDKQIGDLNDKAAERLKKDAEAMKILKKLGIEPK